MEQPVKSASCGTGQLEIGPCHFYVSEVYHLFQLCPFILSAKRCSLRRSHNGGSRSLRQAAYIGGRPQTITQVIEDLGWPSDVGLHRYTMAASSS